jgi:hypothetical protein
MHSKYKTKKFRAKGMNQSGTKKHDLLDFADKYPTKSAVHSLSSNRGIENDLNNF